MEKVREKLVETIFPTKITDISKQDSSTTYEKENRRSDKGTRRTKEIDSNYIEEKDR